jgi:formylmethanofuran dehydrogenase subunit C
MQVVEDTIDAHSDANVKVGGLVVGGTVTHNGEFEDTWLGQDLQNHLQIGNN